MTITIEEKYNSRKVTYGNAYDDFTGSTPIFTRRATSIDISYVVRGALTIEEAIEEVGNEVPQTLNGLRLSTVTGEDEPTELMHVVRVKYQSGSNSNSSAAGGGDGGDTFTFDTTGGTTQITQSLATVDFGGPEVEFVPSGAINDDGENVNGCQIVTPVFNFGMTRWMQDVDDAYKLAVFNLTGKVNDAVFQGFQAGEVLFLGANGSRRQGTNRWQITYSFSASRNRIGMTFGPSLSGIDKKGWEYLWFKYAPRPGVAGQYSIPIAFYVEKVYEDGDFSALGL